jgi:hypothetical protein
MQVEAVARHGFVVERGCGLGRPFALAGVVFDVLERAALRGEVSISAKERSGVSFDAWSSSFANPRLRSHLQGAR